MVLSQSLFQIAIQELFTQNVYFLTPFLNGALPEFISDRHSRIIYAKCLFLNTIFK